MRFERIQATPLAQGQSAQEWQHALEHLDPTRIQLLKPPTSAASPSTPHASATLATHDCVLLLRFASRQIILKLRPLSSWRRRLQRLTRTSQFHRHWRGTALLQQAGIPTATCLAMGTLRLTDSPTPHEWLATSFIEGPTLLHALARVRGTPAEIPLAEAAGRLIASLAKATPRPLFNRDLKPSNVMLLSEWNATPPTHPPGPVPKLAIIDPIGVRPSKATHDGLARMLASLVIEPIGTGVAPTPHARRAAIAALTQAIPHTKTQARELWQSTATLIHAHGDPTPKVNPLPPAKE